MLESEVRDYIQEKLIDKYDVITTRIRINKHAALWTIFHPGGNFIITVEKVKRKDILNKEDNDLDE